MGGGAYVVGIAGACTDTVGEPVAPLLRAVDSFEEIVLPSACDKAP